MIPGWACLPPRRWLIAGIQVGQGGAGFGKLASHPQALEEINGLGERGAGGGQIATQGVETGISMLISRLGPPILIVVGFFEKFI